MHLTSNILKAMQFYQHSPFDVSRVRLVGHICRMSLHFRMPLIYVNGDSTKKYLKALFKDQKYKAVQT